MDFVDAFPPTEKLVLTSERPGEWVRSPYEALEIADAGQPDALTLFWEGCVEAVADANAWAAAQAPLGTLVDYPSTQGTWVAGPLIKLSRPEELPFVAWSRHHEGIFASKPSATRWFSVTESQGAENITYLGTVWPKLQAEILSVGVEVDTVVFGTPDMSQVGANVTPPSPPSVRPSDWEYLVDPTRHFRDGWVLVDLRARQLFGSPAAWFCTYVYRYKYPFSP